MTTWEYLTTPLLIHNTAAKVAGSMSSSVAQIRRLAGSGAARVHQ